MTTTSPPRRALVVIDVQNEYIDGKFRIEYPPVDSSLPKIAQAMDAAHAEGIPIFVVQHVLPSEAPIFAEGTHGVRLHDTVADRPFDYLLTKDLPSVFSAKDFDPWLKKKGIDTLVIVGYMTHNCNDATARDAMHRGYDVEILSDAAGSLPYKNAAGTVSAEDLYRTTLIVMESAYGAVLTTDQWVASLKQPLRAARDNIFHSNQRAIGAMR